MTSASSAPSLRIGEPEPSNQSARIRWLEETVGDLRANNRDLRLILGFLERDSNNLRRDLEFEKARNTSLEEKIHSSIKQLHGVQERNEVLEELMELESDTSFGSEVLHSSTLWKPTTHLTTRGQPTAGLNSPCAQNLKGEVRFLFM